MVLQGAYGLYSASLMLYMMEGAARKYEQVDEGGGTQRNVEHNTRIAHKGNTPRHHTFVVGVSWGGTARLNAFVCAPRIQRDAEHVHRKQIAHDCCHHEQVIHFACCIRYIA